MLANRLATDTASWVALFSRFNSGTYNNQNMILDFKKFKPNQPLANGTLLLCEQVYRRLFHTHTHHSVSVCLSVPLPLSISVCL